MLVFLDWFLFVFHTLLIIFNLFGWVPRVTRRWNLASLLLTAFSWLGLGLFYGIGYCPLTHWHWEIRGQIGRPPMPDSYIKFLADEITGLDFDAALVDTLTGILFAAALLISVVVNGRDISRSMRRADHPSPGRDRL